MGHAFHLAQANFSRARLPLNDAQMTEFVQQLDPVNAIADASPGFLWRLKPDPGEHYVRAYTDDRILFNMSVWDSVETLQRFVYRSAHGSMVQRRAQWFEKDVGPQFALWWIPAGQIPSLADGKERLALIASRGPTGDAFDFRVRFDPPAADDDDSASSAVGR